MSLIVETGAGLSNAQSYTSVAEADLYHSIRGSTLWPNMNESEKEMCLIRATDFMLQKYRLRWKGYRFVTTQALDWPRAGVVMEDFNGMYGLANVSYEVVPVEVKNACAELALRASIGTLSEDRSPRVTQETIGPITVKYDTNSSAVVSYTQVDDILRPYMGGATSGPMMKLARC